MPAESYERVGVIMAGGSGERFWPVSRQDRPKQLLRLTHPDKSMIEEAVERLAPLISSDRVYIATGERLANHVRGAGAGVPDANIFAEPCKRNTAGCLVYVAARLIAGRGDNAPPLSIAVVTADHLIGDAGRFRETLDVAMAAAEDHGALVTHGIIPTRPETGYGYVEADTGSGPVTCTDNVDVYRVAAFREKPDAETASEFVKTGRHYWNSGMFFWTLDAFLRELEAARPEMARAVYDLAHAVRSNDKSETRRIFEALDSVSIDYALMERARNVLVVPADYPWDDVGSWTSLERTRDADAAGNVTHGDPIILDSTGCIVYNAPGAGRMAVGVTGMENVVVVTTEDGVLVMPKDRAQDVRNIVEEIKKQGRPQR